MSRDNWCRELHAICLHPFDHGDECAGSCIEIVDNNDFHARTPPVYCRAPEKTVNPLQHLFQAIDAIVHLLAHERPFKGIESPPRVSIAGQIVTRI